MHRPRSLRPLNAKSDERDAAPFPSASNITALALKIERNRLWTSCVSIIVVGGPSLCAARYLRLDGPAYR